MGSTGLEMRLYEIGGTLFRRREGKHIYPISTVAMCKAGHHYFHVKAREVLDPKFATKSWIVIDRLEVHRER